MEAAEDPEEHKEGALSGHGHEVAPEATSAETLRDIEENEQVTTPGTESGGNAGPQTGPSPDGAFDGDSRESGGDPGPM